MLDTLVQHRVRHLVFALGEAPDPSSLPPHVVEALGSPSRDLVVERAVEHAVAGGADVTALRAEERDALSSAGAAAALRY